MEVSIEKSVTRIYKIYFNEEAKKKKNGNVQRKTNILFQNLLWL